MHLLTKWNYTFWLDDRDLKSKHVLCGTVCWAHRSWRWHYRSAVSDYENMLEQYTHRPLDISETLTRAQDTINLLATMNNATIAPEVLRLPDKSMWWNLLEMGDYHQLVVGQPLILCLDRGPNATLLQTEYLGPSRIDACCCAIKVTKVLQKGHLAEGVLNVYSVNKITHHEFPRNLFFPFKSS